MVKKYKLGGMFSPFFNEINQKGLHLIGSPQGVGFTTYMAHFIAYKIFWEYSYDILILASDDYTQLSYINKIMKAYTFFGRELLYDEPVGIMEQNGKGNSSGAIVLNYKNYDELALRKIISVDKWDLILVDRDNPTPILHNNLDAIMLNTDHVIINSHDIPETVIYQIDDKDKIVLQRERPYNGNINPNSINQYRKILGEFNEI